MGAFDGMVEDVCIVIFPDFRLTSGSKLLADICVPDKLQIIIVSQCFDLVAPQGPDDGPGGMTPKNWTDDNFSLGW